MGREIKRARLPQRAIGVALLLAFPLLFAYAVCATIIRAVARASRAAVSDLDESDVALLVQFLPDVVLCVATGRRAWVERAHAEAERQRAAFYGSLPMRRRGDNAVDALREELSR